jgi:F420-dependent oxidoreductase-like protein
MRIGLALPHYDYSFPDGKPLTWQRLVESAQRAERLGFDSVWISDHFFTDIGRYGGPSGPLGTIEPFTSLAAIATTTQRIRLGTLVACTSFRHPAHVAKMATTIDLLSGGRFDLGLGAGWFEAEFDAFGFDFGTIGERFSVLEENAQVIRSLFGPGPVDFEGRHFTLSGAYNHPQPVQDGGPPIWIGGKGGDRLLRLAARFAAGWNTVWRWTYDEYAERVRAFRAIAEAGGRDPETLRLSIGLYTLVGEDERDLEARYAALQRWLPGPLDRVSLEAFGGDTLTGTPDAVLEQLGRLAELGVEEFIVTAGSLPYAVNDWSMVELLAETVITKARGL